MKLGNILLCIFAITIIFLFLLFFFNKKILLGLNIKNVMNSILTKRVLPNGFCKECNVILISLDTLRAKSLPCYGYEKNTAPNLCEFAKKSFLFTKSFSTSSKTLDSHFSIFTSLYPITHKMTIPFVSYLSEDIVTLTQLLKNDGYSTVYIGPTRDSNLPLEKGLGRGFDFIDGGGDPDGWIQNLDQSDLRGKKFFAFLHTYDVHEPYMPKKENLYEFYSGSVDKLKLLNTLCKKKYEEFIKYNFEENSNSALSVDKYCDIIFADGGKIFQAFSLEELNKNNSLFMKQYWESFDDLDITAKKTYLQALYETKIRELDAKLENFFEYLKNNDLLKNTIIVITADHGEEFYEHLTWTHAKNIYNESLFVPLIIYVPIAKPQIIDKLASNIDVLPSILHLLNINSPPIVQGINLFSESEHEYLIGEQSLDKKQAIITKDWKLIINNDTSDSTYKYELYNLNYDFYEQNNLITKYPDLADNLEKKLRETLSKQPVVEQKNTQPFPTWIDEEQRKKLIETGYF